MLVLGTQKLIDSQLILLYEPNRESVQKKTYKKKQNIVHG